MRIISGTKKGIKLISPEDINIRPTADRVKEALFDMISFDIANSKVLDLFSGTGALGIESLSRGAGFCVFVDRSKKSIELINKNLKKAQMDNDNNFLILNMDFSKALEFLTQKGIIFDIVFIDPPYHNNLYDKALELLIGYNLCSDDCKIILELSKDVKIEDSKNGLICYKEKKYGNTVLKFYTKEKN
ncbi:MAG: 16S rRNA (guanine(966)-N(2))-methyltransferase RsmD [Thermoanaerobacteraceae bacterium]|nr:16S rRNA (guanine(966)-N(2))-methyltransferase RsmD [Thermoanaerobacteraceae bacterium]